MYLLNRVSLVGRINDFPNVLLQGQNRELMTFQLSTVETDQKETMQDREHKVLVEEPSLILYARTFLTPGNLVFVEGGLEYIRVDSRDSCEAWIVVSSPHDILHPLCFAQAPTKQARARESFSTGVG